MRIDKQNQGPGLRRVQDLAEVRLRDALLKAVGTLKARPEPRWRWDNVAANRSQPWRPVFRMLADAVHAGASIDDALAFVRELEGQLVAIADGRRIAPPDVHALDSLMVAEVRADAAADIAQTEAAVAPSRQALERLIETREAQESAAGRLVAAARRFLTSPITIRRRLA